MIGEREPDTMGVFQSATECPPFYSVDILSLVEWNHLSHCFCSKANKCARTGRVTGQEPNTSASLRAREAFGQRTRTTRAFQVKPSFAHSGGGRERERERERERVRKRVLSVKRGISGGCWRRNFNMRRKCFLKLGARPPLVGPPRVT